MASTANPTRDDFAAMLDEQLGGAGDEGFEGRVVKGTVTAIENGMAHIDVGLKSEGRVDLKEFQRSETETAPGVGDEVEVFVDRVENAEGEAMLSRDRARREAAWDKLESEFGEGKRVEGRIFGRVKGGFTVDLDGAVAFLPGSQVDIRPVRDVTPLMDMAQPFQILKMDRRRGNIVVSRRAVLEETRAEQRSELIDKLAEGQVIDGVVKNITDYGAFVDLGGVDGLLHVTDIAWRRVNHPSEVLQIGETINVQVIRFNAETQRISLGMKQLETDPWEDVEAKYPPESKFTGRVTNITDYGAFVELEPGVEGLVHVSEMSWTKKNVHPGKIVSTSQEVEVMVLDADPEKRRISLGLKQCQSNPWEGFQTKFTVGSEVEGEIKNITEFGLFIGLDGEIDGLAHLSDLSWNKSGEEAFTDYKKGDLVKAKVLDVDVDKERISLGIKQLTEDTVADELTTAQRQLLERYVEAFWRKDVDTIVSMLTAEAVWEMPPFTSWFKGRANIAWLIGNECPGGSEDMPMIETRANGQPAFGLYMRTPEGGFVPFQLQVLQWDGDPDHPEVSQVDAFFDTRLFETFGLPMSLPADHRPDRPAGVAASAAPPA